MTKEEKKNVAAAAGANVDKAAFVQRKLKVMNQKGTAVHQRNATRVVENNK
ncbi:hypothetical protein NRIC_03920 [Enterococcus florum]|uniref:Uncharacterized protein n=1 Tax=Enterococcus florum TaxID=2480627 RepID=A0A4P5P8F7_9ENTE|nr:hypothetical protein [Enterococcus florum]GCF92501.1 hypothetical protein NRIC_03920 [Enterococcus florum]